MEMKEKIIQSLKSLGSSSEEIACNLKEKGIKGRIKNYNDCPISRFLREILPDYLFFVVTNYANEVGYIDYYQHDFFDCLKTNEIQNVLNFADDFDQKKYPDLIA